MKRVRTWVCLIGWVVALCIASQVQVLAQETSVRQHEDGYECVQIVEEKGFED